MALATRLLWRLCFGVPLADLLFFGRSRSCVTMTSHRVQAPGSLSYEQHCSDTFLADMTAMLSPVVSCPLTSISVPRVGFFFGALMQARNSRIPIRHPPKTDLSAEPSGSPRFRTEVTLAVGRCLLRILRGPRKEVSLRIPWQSLEKRILI